MTTNMSSTINNDNNDNNTNTTEHQNNSNNTNNKIIVNIIMCTLSIYTIRIKRRTGSNFQKSRFSHVFFEIAFPLRRGAHFDGPNAISPPGPQ